MRRVLFMALKEFTQLLRDWRTLLLTLVLPVAVLLLFGYAITLDIKDVSMAVVDHSRSKSSRHLISRFSGSGYFLAKPADKEGAARMLEEREAMLALVIPVDFAEKVESGAKVSVQILVDGSESNSSSIALGYAQGIIRDYAFEKTIGPVVRSGLMSDSSIPPIRLSPRARFNPSLKNSSFIVPGLVAIIMMITVVVLSSLSIVKERELGTLETIMVSPMRRSELILGKLLPYFILGFADLFIIVGAGIVLFGVPFRGSAFNLVLLSGLFIVGGLGMGLFISTVAETQRTAWMISLLSTLLPSIILSGFLFPIRMMPQWLQLVTYIVPVRYYLVVVRGIVLKGTTLIDLWPQILALSIFAAITIVLSVARFRKRT